MKLTLYYSSRSCAFAPHILLFDTKADFDAVKIDFNKSEQKSDTYLQINPKGRVPALLTARGILTETPAILLYIAQLYSDKNLAPNDAFLLAEAQAFNMFLASTVHVAHAHKHRGNRWVDNEEAEKAMTAKVLENMTECASMIETHYFKGPYVLGENYSICDPYLALIFRWLYLDGVKISAFPGLCKHNELMKERVSMQKAMALYDYPDPS